MTKTQDYATAADDTVIMNNPVTASLIPLSHKSLETTLSYWFEIYRKTSPSQPNGEGDQKWEARSLLHLATIVCYTQGPQANNTWNNSDNFPKQRRFMQ